HIVVTVPDWIADAEGLYVADFDLLARIPGLERLEIVCTDRVLATGFQERLHDWLPGLDETRFDTAGNARPVLIAGESEPWLTVRDREEELIAVARQLETDRRTGDAVPLDRTAVVFKHPLPYLYMAPEVFGSAGIPYQTPDGLPLAAEPTAAALDLVLDAVSANFTRATLVALLRSPHLVFTCDGVEVPRQSITPLAPFLRDARYLGALPRLETLGRGAAHSTALLAALDVARELAPLATARPASQQLEHLLAFWSAHLGPLARDDRFAEREQRARAAIAEM